MSLTFDALRAANIERLPLFKNRHGGLAHSEPDGSDWPPAMWFLALVGEIGEWAEVRMQYEAGVISAEEYHAKSEKELADIATYLDILARRSKDVATEPSVINASAAQRLLHLVSALGHYANGRKKLVRGDYTREEFLELAEGGMSMVINSAKMLHDLEHSSTPPKDFAPVTRADPTGVNLGEAIRAKFNEVSQRVGADVWL